MTLTYWKSKILKSTLILLCNITIQRFVPCLKFTSIFINEYYFTLFQVHICHRSRIGKWSLKNWKQASLTRPSRPEVCQRNRQRLALLLPLLSLFSTQPLLSYLYLYFFLSSTFFLICGKCLSPDKILKLLTPKLQIIVTPCMNVLSFLIICKKIINYR